MSQEEKEYRQAEKEARKMQWEQEMRLMEQMMNNSQGHNKMNRFGGGSTEDESGF